MLLYTKIIHSEWYGQNNYFEIVNFEHDWRIICPYRISTLDKSTYCLLEIHKLYTVNDTDRIIIVSY